MSTSLLAIAEDERVLDVLGAQQAAQRFALVRRCCTMTSPCTTVAAGEAGGATATSFGFIRNASASRRISGGMVAEKNSVWRIFGSSDTMRSTSGMKPMSSMRSASSITRILTSFEQDDLPRSKRSSRRPGVAISTSTPRSSLLSWSAKLSPPISSAMAQLVVLAVVVEIVGDLRRQFARRLDDQRARHARTGAAVGQHVDHRQGEGGGLAGAGLGATEHVAPDQNIRNGLFLDGGRGFVTRVFDRLKDLI